MAISSGPLPIVQMSWLGHTKPVSYSKRGGEGGEDWGVITELGQGLGDRMNRLRSNQT